MEDKGVKVVVDYTNGSYNVIGMYNGEAYTISKPIRGQDRDGYFKASYSRRLMKYRRKEMERNLRRISITEPDFKYSKKMIKKVDPLMYKALEDWDMMLGTSYALDYLKTMIQKFDKDQSFYVAREFYDENCASARKNDLARAGIDISYNVGLFNTSNSLNIFDRIKGMIIARDQAKLIKANIQSSLVLKEDYYLDDIDRFMLNDRVDDDYYTTIEEEEEEQRRNRATEVQEIMREQTEEEQQRKNRAAEVQKIMSEQVEEEQRKNRATEVQKIMSEKIEGQQILDRESQENDKKRTVYTPHIPEDSSKKYENTGKNKVVRNHTDVRTEPTKRQRENAARKAKKEYNSHYNTQMRLKAEREVQKQQAEERMRKAAEKKETERQSFANKLEETRRMFAEETIIGERGTKRQSFAKKLEKETRRLVIEEATTEGNDARTERKIRISNITNNKFSRRAKAELRHWHRKLRDTKESIKNKTFKPHNGKKLQISIPKFKIPKVDFFRLERRIKAEGRHFKRKLRSSKESIKNMKFKPHLSKKGKKILIKGVVGVLALGILFGSAKMCNSNRNNIQPETNTIITEEYNEQTETAPIETEQAVVEQEETKPAETEQVETEQEETKPAEMEQIETEQEEAKPAETEQVETEQEETKPAETEQVETEQEEAKPAETEQEETKPAETEQVETEQEETTQTETEKNESEQGNTEKTEEEKVEEFKKVALQKYQEALIIGETPQIGDILMDQSYSENPDGTGNVGYFASHPDYAIGHINIVTNDGYEVVRADGRNLSELLAEYPDYITYNIYFVNSKTGGWLGFVTQEQYEQIVQNKINQIIKTKTNDKNVTLDQDDIMR